MTKGQFSHLIIIYTNTCISRNSTQLVFWTDALIGEDISVQISSPAVPLQRSYQYLPLCYSKTIQSLIIFTDKLNFFFCSAL